MISSEKKRLLSVLQKESVDRPPVICTGGMMNAAIVDIMRGTRYALPQAHFDSSLMSELAYEVHRSTGFENIGIPFCMTVEAEVLGSDIDFGTLECEPKIAKERFGSIKDAQFPNASVLITKGRIPQICEAAKLLSERYPSIPVIGNLTGPISTAASVIDPVTFYKELRKFPDIAHRVLSQITYFLISYALALVKNGVSVISVGDPSATGEILGPKLFEEFVIPYINRLIDSVNKFGTPVLLHICGDLNPVRHLLKLIHSQAISTDAMVNLSSLKKEFPDLVTMGNVSTYALENNNEDKIKQITYKLICDKVNILSPACGLSTSTPLSNIRALTDTVKGYR